MTMLAFLFTFQFFGSAGYAGETDLIEWPIESPPDTIPPDTTDSIQEGNGEQASTSTIDEIIITLNELF